MNISKNLDDAINAIYQRDPNWCRQLRAAIAGGATEREVWHRIDCAKGSSNQTRTRAYSAVAAAAREALAVEAE